MDPTGYEGLAEIIDGVMPEPRRATKPRLVWFGLPRWLVMTEGQAGRDRRWFGREPTSAVLKDMTSSFPTVPMRFGSTPPTVVRNRTEPRAGGDCEHCERRLW